jgi:hypothetical protein
MHILLVNCFDGNSVSQKEFTTFQRLFQDWLRTSPLKTGVGSFNVTVRRCNELYDYALDWEYDVLDLNAKNICRRFDCLNLIVVVGDMRIAPWNMNNSQLITLLWMAELCNKPTLCCGSGAFSAVYAAAGQGTKFNVLNQPIGDTIEKLGSFPRYSKQLSQFPGVWLHNETGDLYSYGQQYNVWRPVCNIGIFRHASQGTPTPARFRAPPKHFSA